MTPTATLSSGKRLFFYLVLLSPLLALVGGVLYLALGTSLVQDVYLASWRNLDLPCQQWTNEGFGYKGKAGGCLLSNPEYRTVVSFDQEGFRNTDTRQQADVILIGDSHTQGFGVRDHETFAELLHTRYHHRTKNLGMSSYATFRELEALKVYLTEEKVVVIQYCENDAQENKASLALDRDEFLRQVRERWDFARSRYATRKARGAMGTLSDFAQALMAGKYKRMPEYKKRRLSRNMPWEAENFAKTVATYRSQLTGKKVIVFESSSYGFNHPAFKSLVDAALLQHAPGLDITVLDSHSLLTSSDYYRIDDHLNPRGHEHVAQMLEPLIAEAVRSSPQ